MDVAIVPKELYVRMRWPMQFVDLTAMPGVTRASVPRVSDLFSRPRRPNLHHDQPVEYLDGFDGWGSIAVFYAAGSTVDSKGFPAGTALLARVTF